jgi:D-sedoheptulose 7-phosphate isomerase
VRALWLLLSYILEESLRIAKLFESSYVKRGQNLINSHVNELIDILKSFEKSSKDVITMIVKSISETFEDGGKILICGNGGSAADSQHFAAEFVSSFSKDIQRKSLPALALTTDSSIITAYSNDYSFEGIFARQVEAFGKPGDILIALSTSGNSLNCIKAIEMANSLGLKTISFTGDSGQLRSNVDINLGISSSNTQIIQEVHLVAYHLIVEMVEENLFRKLKI